MEDEPPETLATEGTTTTLPPDNFHAAPGAGRHTVRVLEHRADRQPGSGRRLVVRRNALRPQRLRHAGRVPARRRTRRGPTGAGQRMGAVRGRTHLHLPAPRRRGVPRRERPGRHRRGQKLGAHPGRWSGAVHPAGQRGELHRQRALRGEDHPRAARRLLHRFAAQGSDRLRRGHRRPLDPRRPVGHRLVRRERSRIGPLRARRAGPRHDHPRRLRRLLAGVPAGHPPPGSPCGPTPT